MCTAVVGGSIHRAAKRISAASDQRRTNPMTSHRIKERTEVLPSRFLMCVFSVVVTFRNNSPGWVISTNGEIAGDKGIDVNATRSPRDPDRAARLMPAGDKQARQHTSRNSLMTALEPRSRRCCG